MSVKMLLNQYRLKIWQHCRIHSVARFFWPNQSYNKPAMPYLLANAPWETRLTPTAARRPAMPLAMREAASRAKILTRPDGPKTGHSRMLPQTVKEKNVMDQDHVC